MSGFAACINCCDRASDRECNGWNMGQTQSDHRGPCNGNDRATCNQDDNEACHHSEFHSMWNPITGARPDCWQTDENYCNDGTYDPNGRRDVGGDPWTSRFYVREEVPLSRAILNEIGSCEASGRFWDRDQMECVDEPPEPQYVRVGTGWCLDSDQGQLPAMYRNAAPLDELMQMCDRFDECIAVDVNNNENGHTRWSSTDAMNRNANQIGGWDTWAGECQEGCRADYSGDAGGECWRKQ